MDHYREALPPGQRRIGAAEFPRQLIDASLWLGDLSDEVQDKLRNVPLLLTWGLHDLAFPRQYMDRFREDFVRSQVCRLDAKQLHPGRQSRRDLCSDQGLLGQHPFNHEPCLAVTLLIIGIGGPLGRDLQIRRLWLGPEHDRQRVSVGHNGGQRQRVIGARIRTGVAASKRLRRTPTVRRPRIPGVLHHLQHLQLRSGRLGARWRAVASRRLPGRIGDARSVGTRRRYVAGDGVRLTGLSDTSTKKEEARSRRIGCGLLYGRCRTRNKSDQVQKSLKHRGFSAVRPALASCGVLEATL